jgi:hypothetical protein
MAFRGRCRRDSRGEQDQSHRAQVQALVATAMSHFLLFALPRPVPSLAGSMVSSAKLRGLVPTGRLALAREAGDRRARRRAVRLSAVAATAEKELRAT